MRECHARLTASTSRWFEVVFAQTKESDLKPLFFGALFSAFAVVGVLGGDEASDKVAKSGLTEGHPWLSFKRGSWVIVRESGTRGTTIVDRREKLVLSTSPSKPSGNSVLQYDEVDGELSGRPRVIDRDVKPAPWELPAVSLKESREEALQIDGKSYPCTVSTYHGPGSRAESRFTMTVWRSKDSLMPYRPSGGSGIEFGLPGDVLRVDYSLKGPRMNEQIQLRVSSFNVVRRIDKASVRCVQEEGRVVLEARGKRTEVTVRVLLSREVPGFMVEIASKGTHEGKPLERLKRVEAFGIGSTDREDTERRTEEEQRGTDDAVRSQERLPADPESLSPGA